MTMLFEFPFISSSYASGNMFSWLHPYNVGAPQNFIFDTLSYVSSPCISSALESVSFSIPELLSLIPIYIICYQMSSTPHMGAAIFICSTLFLTSLSLLHFSLRDLFPSICGLVGTLILVKIPVPQSNGDRAWPGPISPLHEMTHRY